MNKDTQFPLGNLALRERKHIGQSRRGMYGWRMFSFHLPPIKQNIGCGVINRKGDLQGEKREESIAQVEDNSEEHVIQRRGRGNSCSQDERCLTAMRKKPKMGAMADG